MRPTTSSRRHAFLFGQISLWSMLLCIVVATPGSAYAQYATGTEDVIDFTEQLDRDRFIVLARARSVGIPGFLLDFGFETHPNHWRDGQSNFSFGAEFIWEKRGAFELGFGVDYVDLSFRDDFWKRVDTQASETDWVEADLQLLALTFTNYWHWEPSPWFMPYLGFGLGMGFVLNDVVKYPPRAGSACEAAFEEGLERPEVCLGAADQADPTQIALDAGQPDEDIWPVVPLLNLTGGARLRIYRNLLLSVDLGFTGFAYGGVSLGVIW